MDEIEVLPPMYAYGHMLDTFVSANQTHVTGGLTGYCRENFKRPTHIQLVRYARCFVYYLVTLVIFWFSGAAYDSPKELVFVAMLGSMLGFIILPTSSIFVAILIIIIIQVGFTFGICLELLGQYFIVAYNLSDIEPKSSSAYAGISLSWLAFIFYAGSYAQFNNPASVFGGIAGAIMPSALMVVERVATLDQRTSVSTDAFVLLQWMLVICVLNLIFCAFVLPEQPTELCKYRVIAGIERMQVMLRGQLRGTEKLEVSSVEMDSDTRMTEMRKLYNGLLADAAACQASVKGTYMEFGWFYDAPFDVARVVGLFTKCVRHVGTLVETAERSVLTASRNDASVKEMRAGVNDQLVSVCRTCILWLDDALGAVHDSLIAPPGFLGPVTSFPNAKPVVQGSLDEAWARVDASKESVHSQMKAYVEMLQNLSDEQLDTYFAQFDKQQLAFNLSLNTQMYILGLHCLMDDVEKLSALARSIKLARLDKRTFYYPTKGFPKRTKTKKEKKPTGKPLTWSSFWNDLLFGIFQFVSSDAGHFALRRTVLMLLVCMFAFLPATEAFFAANHGYWIALTVLLITYPSVGATISRLSMRIIGVLVGCLWAYFSVLAFPNNYAATYAFVVPLAIPCFYFLTCTTQPYIGYSTLMSYCIVAIIPGNTAELAWLRSAMTLLGLTIGSVGSLLLYPMLARTDARVAFGNVLHNVSELFNRVNSMPLVVADEMPLEENHVKFTGLYESTQTLITKTRTTTLYFAAGEPDLDRPYQHEYMEAVGASIQRLLDCISSMLDTFMMLRRSEQSVEMLKVVAPEWDQDREAMMRLVNVYLNVLSNSLITKLPLPSEQGSPRVSCRQALTRLSPSEFSSKLHATSREAFVMVASVSAVLSIVGELEILEDLLAKIYGRQSWFPRGDDDIGVVQDMRPLKQA